MSLFPEQDARDRVHALVDQRVEAALADIRRMASAARRSIGQRNRRTQEQIQKTSQPAQRGPLPGGTSARPFHANPAAGGITGSPSPASQAVLAPRP